MPLRDLEKRRAYMKKYQAEWQRKNREKCNALSRVWAKKHPDKIKVYTKKCEIRRKYGLTLEQLEEMKQRQKGLCAICGKLPGRRGLFVDHNHRTGKVRELLCGTCNWLVGVYETRGMIGVWTYLSKHKE